MGKKYIVIGAPLECTMGSYSTKLNLTMSHGFYFENKPVANISDCMVGVNVIPFGTCKSTGSNPCAPVLAPAWVNGKMDTLIQGMPALTEDSILVCTLGGMIKIKDSGQ